jgi:hypothetical protein
MLVPSPGSLSQEIQPPEPLDGMPDNLHWREDIKILTNYEGFVLTGRPADGYLSLLCLS